MVSARTFTEVVPYYQYERTEGGWRDGMVTGNGHTGVICSGAPYSETLIYQNIEFIMPSRDPRKTPEEVTSQLNEARQAVVNSDDTWNVHDRKRTFLYCFHPAYQLRLEMPKWEILDYVRQTDYETAEVSVKYTDQSGTWIRKTLTSREDDVTVIAIMSSDQGAGVNVTISIDDFASMPRFGRGDEINMQYKKLVDDQSTYIAVGTHYPEYPGSELARGGYAGVSRVIVVGGSQQKVLLEDSSRDPANIGKEKHPSIVVTDADAVYILTKTARTHQMGSLRDFAEQDQYELVEQLLTEIKAVEKKHLDSEGNFSYELALRPHAAKHSSLYNKVTFTLGTNWDDKVQRRIIKPTERECGAFGCTCRTYLQPRQVYPDLLWRLFCSQTLRPVDRRMESGLARRLYNGCQC